MNYKNTKNNTSTSIQNVQNSTLSVKDTSSNVEWSKEQQEILQQRHEEEIANEMMYDSQESHKFTCNYVECN